MARKLDALDQEILKKPAPELAEKRGYRPDGEKMQKRLYSKNFEVIP